jgi:hypothetical protein
MLHMNVPAGPLQVGAFRPVVARYEVLLTKACSWTSACSALIVQDGFAELVTAEKLVKALRRGASQQNLSWDYIRG